MVRWTRNAAVVCGWWLALAPARADEPVWWIWHAADGDATRDAPAETRYFRRAFDVPAGRTLRRAELVLGVDNGARVWVNGRDLGHWSAWKPAKRVSLTGIVRPGRNVIAVEAVNAPAEKPTQPNPAGLIARIVVQYERGAKTVIATNRQWRSTAKVGGRWYAVDTDDRAWPAARQLAQPGHPPWGGIPQMIDPNESLPRFHVPGQDDVMRSLQALMALHYPGSGPKATLWDAWLPQASLWPATQQGGQFRSAWRSALLGRKISPEGYVCTHQHRGLAHNDGWPFPLWTQVAGAGFHFAPEHQPYPAPMRKDLKGFALAGFAKPRMHPKTGAHLTVTAHSAMLTTPPTRFGTIVAPFVRLAWEVRDLPEAAKLHLEWTTDKARAYSPERRVAIDRPSGEGLTFTHVEMYRHPKWKGQITGLRVRLEGAAGAKLALRSLITAVDSRHNINNSFFLHGCDEYVRWTGDIAFLRESMPRMRHALRYAMSEFRTREHKCVLTPWVGHDGRSGLVRTKANKTVRRIGLGVGNNYWDLLPFGGKDCLATIYLYHALRRLADLERAVAANPKWSVPDTHRLDPADLDRHADEIKAAAGTLFWNGKTGRFVAAVDVDGKAWDYGFTFVNLEAIYYDFATPEQARSILAWVAGERTVAGDTSTGADIYHWRFGPRSTTRRNIDYYTSVWIHPHHIPWGYQVQDGGAVLGFSYFDLMARLATLGPDDAWQRVKAIANWFDEVQAAGGYRTYYKDPRRGTLQGGGPPGGLGMDREFFESALVPQVMLYGFLGVRPEVDGLRVRPALPKDWREVTIDRIRLHGQTLQVTATRDMISVRRGDDSPDAKALRLYPPRGTWQMYVLAGAKSPLPEFKAVTIAKATDSVPLSLAQGQTLVVTRK